MFDRKAVDLVAQIPDPAWRLILCLAVLSCGLAITPKHISTVDEVSMFTASVNAARDGKAHTNQISYTLWVTNPGDAVTKLGSGGDTYTKKSPVTVLLLVPLAMLGDLIPRLSEMRTALFLGPILAAATAFLLYTFARRLGYRRLASTAMVVVFSFCTMAFPYQQTIFGELTCSFGLLLALWGATMAQRSPSPTDSRSAALCGLGLAVAMGSNASYALLAPIFALALVARRTSADSLKRRCWMLLCFALPITLAGVGLLLYNYTRFGSLVETGYGFASRVEGFDTPLWRGVLGLTISPGYGFLWYNPPSLLAILGWARLRRNHRGLSWMILAVVCVHLVVFGSWHGQHGGYAWGPRYLLPLVPYMGLASLPLLASLLKGNTAGRIAVMFVAVLGLAVQVGAVMISPVLYKDELHSQSTTPADSEFTFDVAKSPILAHWRMLPTSSHQLALFSGDGAPPKHPQLLSAILTEQKEGDVIVSLVPELLLEMLEQPKLPAVHGLPFNLPASDPTARILFERALRDANRVWMITWYGPGDPGNWYEAELRQRWASVKERNANGLRLILLARPPVSCEWRDVRVTFDHIRLSKYTVHSANDALFVQLAWQATAPIQQDYTTFVHFLDGNQDLITQQDRQPLGGYKPTTDWTPGEVIIDRFVFPLDENQMPEARVAVGWYEWPSLERLPVRDADGTDLGTAFMLAEDEAQ